MTSHLLNLEYIDKPNSNTYTDTSKLPPAIDIFGSIDGCNVDLYIQPSYQISGAFIYRSRDGSSFERIATIPQFTGDHSKLKYTDENQSGVVSYYAAVFNSYGENPGPAKVFPLDQTNCGNQNNFPQTHTSWLEENGDLSLIENLDTAYLYVQINGNQAERVPKGNQMFLPNSGVKFNINSYLESRDDLMTMTDFNVHMEIWGWQGGELRFAGNVDHTVHRTVLLVCDTEGEGKCFEGSLGNWDTEMTILPHIYIPLNEQKYELRWLTSTYSYTNKVCIGIGEDFNGPGLTDSNPTLLKLCFSNAKVEDNQGTYLLDFGEILYHGGEPKFPSYNGINENYQYPDFDKRHPLGDPFSLAIRVLPLMKDSDLNDVSNTVNMHHLTRYEQSDEPPLASNVPSLYDIEILEDTYKPPTYEIRTKWACVIIDEDPTGKYSPGDEVCPLTYVECGVNMTCTDSGFLGTLGAAWDMIVNGYDDAKQGIADGISDTIPYCDDSQKCKDAVRSGVDYAITYYTGIPADLPKSDEAASSAVTMLITSYLSDVSDAEGIEYLCDQYCEEQIAALLDDHFAKEEIYKFGQPGCYDKADHYGYFPICFEPPTLVHASPGAGNFPGFVFVRVTRKDTPQSLAATDELKGKTQLNITVDGFNDSRIGEYASFCRYQDNMTQDDLPYPEDPNSNGNRGYGYLGDSPMEEPLFETVQVEIPWLEPGQSIAIPIKLQQIQNQYNQGCIRTAHSQYLFYHGTSHMEATEYCYSEGSTQSWVPCSEGGSDIWDFNNPAGP